MKYTLFVSAIVVVSLLGGLCLLVYMYNQNAPFPEEVASSPETTKIGAPVVATSTATITPAMPERTSSSTSEIIAQNNTEPTNPTPVPKPPKPAPEPPLPTPPVATPVTEIPLEPSIPAPKLQWGAFPGSNRSDFNTFTTQIPEEPDYIAHFVHWANHGGLPSPWVGEAVRDQGSTLVLFWEASDYIIGGTNQPNYAYRTIIRGDHDVYIETFADYLRAYAGPVILVPFSEMNGDWSPWSGTQNGNSPEDMIAAYRHLHGFFTDVPNVSFGWAVNARSVPDTLENHLTRYYPGDAYVDYVGVDGFNFGTPWESFDTIFADPLSTLASYQKPTLIFSFASAPGSQKAAWLTDALTVQLPRYPHVTGFVYFNQDKERNWLLWSDPQTVQVWRDYVEK